MIEPKTITISEREENILLNTAYIRASSKLVISALQEGDDVLQMDNGEILITTTRITT